MEDLPPPAANVLQRGNPEVALEKEKTQVQEGEYGDKGVGVARKGGRGTKEAGRLRREGRGNRAQRPAIRSCSENSEVRPPGGIERRWRVGGASSRPIRRSQGRRNQREEAARRAALVPCLALPPAGLRWAFVLSFRTRLQHEESEVCFLVSGVCLSFSGGLFLVAFRPFFSKHT